jgi:hypothetical protein
MLNGVILGVALMVSSTGVPAASPAAPGALVPARFAFTLRQAGAMQQASPRPILDEQSRDVWRSASFQPAQAKPAKRFSKSDRIIATIAGGVGGWFGGAMIGYYSTANFDNPDDDTSGLKGVMIGAPIGGAVGAILGYWLTNR